MAAETSSGIAPVLWTEQTIDPLYTEPFIICSEERSEPAPHRYVHGGFRGTPARFSFYFPPAAQYRGRFHHNTYPLADSSDVGPFPIEFQVATGDIGFTFDSGAYYVQTNNGSAFVLGSDHPSVAAFRANAAAAKFSRIVAAEIYGDHRPFGYLYGGSGGAYQTIGAAEQTSGVWDGFMPFVTGCNFATPSNFTVRMHALRVLRQRNRFASIMDAIDAGGSGDPCTGLNEEERAAFDEATLMGFPPAGWYSHETMDAGYFANLSGAVPRFDPTYVDDFWTKPGYLGADPASSIHAARLRFETHVAGVDTGATTTVELATIPDVDFANSHLVVLDGPMTGRSLPIKAVRDHAVSFTTTADPELVAAFKPSMAVRIDNSWPLALQTYHRHQVPPGQEFRGWNQFRDAAGEPRYPQRPALVGEPFTVSSAGALLSGNVQTKTLLVQAHMDVDSFAWFADWYRGEVERVLGSGYRDRFALWFVERAQHENPLTALANAHAVSAAGVLQQGLRDLARWVEEGMRPVDTNYSVEGSQVLLPTTAQERGGPQPVMRLTANGASRAEVAAGRDVAFVAVIEMPPGTGTIVAAEWNFASAGTYPVKVDVAEPASSLVLSNNHRYQEPGTYFTVLRVTAQREANEGSRYARVQNLARVRVVVR